MRKTFCQLLLFILSFICIFTLNACNSPDVDSTSAQEHSFPNQNPDYIPPQTDIGDVEFDRDPGTPGLEIDWRIYSAGVVVCGIGTASEADIVIPAFYEDAPVVAICVGAFQDYTSMKSITIPSTIQFIEDDAFLGCDNLEAVYIKDIAAWCNIEFQSEFSDAPSNPLAYAEKLYIKGNDLPITELTIPEGVTKINNYAFYGCKAIQKLQLPDSITTIGQGGF